MRRRGIPWACLRTTPCECVALFLSVLARPASCFSVASCLVAWADCRTALFITQATSENVGDIADEWDNDLTLVPKRHLEAKAVGLDLTVPVKNTKIRVVPDPALNKLARDVESGLQQPEQTQEEADAELEAMLASGKRRTVATYMSIDARERRAADPGDEAGASIDMSLDPTLTEGSTLPPALAIGEESAQTGSGTSPVQQATTAALLAMAEEQVMAKLKQDLEGEFQKKMARLEEKTKVCAAFYLFILRCLRYLPVCVYNSATAILLLPQLA